MSLSEKQQAARDRAVKLLTHYIQTIGEKAGCKMEGGDTQAEIGEAVDAILEAAEPDPETEHAKAVRHLMEENRRRGNLGRLADGSEEVPQT